MVIVCWRYVNGCWKMMLTAKNRQTSWDASLFILRHLFSYGVNTMGNREPSPHRVVRLTAPLFALRHALFLDRLAETAVEMRDGWKWTGLEAADGDTIARGEG